MVNLAQYLSFNLGLQQLLNKLNILVPTCDGFPSEEGTRAVSYYSPPDPTLMAAPDGRYSAGSTAVFRCTDDHHDLIGPLSLTCLQDNQWKAQWNGTEPRCGNY